MTTLAAAAVVVAVVLDRVLPGSVSLAPAFDRVPAVASAAVSLVFAGAAFVLVFAGASAHPYAGATVATLALLLAGRFTPVVEAADGDAAARVERLGRALVTRRVAPVFAFALGSQASLAVGAAAALFLGSFLTFAGRGYAPTVAVLSTGSAQASALFIAAAARDPDAPLRARRWVSLVGSRVTGWPTATLAAALGVRLESERYVLNDVGLTPTAEQLGYAARVVSRAGLSAALVAALVAWP